MQEEGWKVHVSFATDRAQIQGSPNVIAFGGNRGALVTGHAFVNIPKTHVEGNIEVPSLWRLEFGPDRARHMFVLASKLQSAKDWIQDIRLKVGESKDSSALLFVHGYNVTFNEALLRTAQIQHDLAFAGASVLFSWPSSGREVDYPKDETNAAWAVPHLASTLRLLLAGSNAKKVILIAHSMGNRVLTDVLREIAIKNPAARSRIKEVILAAPDIDADIFRRDIAPRVAAISQRTTLYASSKDWALKASKRFHGYRRAGDTNLGVVVASPVQTIDVTAANGDFLGHSYIGDNRFVLSDVRKLLDGFATPAARGMLKAGSPNATYWRFPPCKPVPTKPC